MDVITGKAWEIVAYVGTFTIYMLLKADRWNRLKRVNVETILYNLLFMLMKKTNTFSQHLLAHDIIILQNRRLLQLSSDQHVQSYEAIPSQGSSLNQGSAIDEKFGLLWIFLYLYLTRVWGTIRFFIFVVHNGSPYLPTVNKVDRVLLYFQSVGDSAQGFVNFMGLILLPHIFNQCH